MGIETAFLDFPLLETDRLLLREIRLSDAPNMYSYFSKDEVTEYYDLESFTSEKQAEDLIHRFHQRYSERKQIRWAITLKDNDQLIGTCGFHAIEEEHYKAEIGYELHPNFWGQGIMTEVITAVIHYGFNNMLLNRIEAFYDPRNGSSGRVLEKNGFIFEGVLKKRYFEKGKFVDAAISAILKDKIR
ncbi:GNAT family N-acetyltransferase [Cytobacillus solani]|uniref:Acetyltransferase n=1 Tax=Cytobacillus solani TaxID=1637975 RepID=A0A0Q3QS11_9BACI|nr:GNAT family N-acetyltransferase [Cytobacillus solani]KOP84162.1 acetyltransferase [Bacillus sp. FJAT-21945]KQL20945.1 acetyltransferase [Cytobacillus solani]USK54188.1 GNAT family N-acetyltransferase [Cytobacillus solani]